MDVQIIAKHNDGVKYLLSVRDVFSKCLHLVPLKNKTGQSVATALLSILRETRYNKPIKRRPLQLRTDMGKEFLNTTFQNMLKREGIEFSTCRNPDVKCAIVERTHRTIRDKIKTILHITTRFDLLTTCPNL
jgi:transposase InsO family protein